MRCRCWVFVSGVAFLPGEAGEKGADCWGLAMLAPFWDEPKRGVAGVRRAFFALARAFESGIAAGFDSLSEGGSSSLAKIPARRFARQRMNSNVKVGCLMAIATIFVLDLRYSFWTVLFS
jgi:hypothetical protein